MKIVIGIQTCNRINFTRKTIESIITFNPEAVDMPWIIADDGSTDGTMDYINTLNFVDCCIEYPKQSGITACMERLVNKAIEYGDIILYIQNDWEQIRHINFKAVETFYESNVDTGHIAMIKDKGRKGHVRLSAFGLGVNLYTKESVKTGKPIKIDQETFIPGNWNYADIPNFTRLDLAIKMFDGIHYGKGAEGVRVKNFHRFRCNNYLLDNQPYLNIDYNSRTQTPHRKL